MELHLPLDFQSLPEYRLFVADLGQNQTVLQPLTETRAIALFIRLFVDLGHEAARTGRAGFISGPGLKLLKLALTDDVIASMRQAGLLTPHEDGFYCERFERHNSHLSPRHEKKEDVGARHSAIARNKRNIAAEASQQAMLLPPEIWKDRAGQPVPPSLIQRLLVFIRTLDNCLNIKNRHKTQYTEGLIADAAHAWQWIENNLPASTPEGSHDDSARQRFYFWINDRINESHPAVHRTTEQLLANWDDLAALWKAARDGG